MHQFFSFLKSQATVLNLFCLLVVLAFIFNRFHQRKFFRRFLYAAFGWFLLSSTHYLPHYLAGKLEQQYLPLDIEANPSLKKTKLLIHVLGNDYKLEKGLPANSMLGLGSLARLAEAIRLNRLLDSSTIICSANGPAGAETQAEVTKRAAILLGVEAARVDVLTTPSTTKEEARDLAQKYGGKSPVIIVTEAVHMPRAVRLFKAAGFDPIAAPTNFKTSRVDRFAWLGWIPTIENIDLMNRVMHEYLASLKG